MGHITYHRLDVLTEEFRDLLSNEAEEGEASDEELPLPFEKEKHSSLKKRFSHNSNAKQSLKLLPEPDLLEISLKDKKHIIILGK